MLGFTPYVLKHIKSLMEANYPGLKITPSGFLRLLIANNPTLDISSINGTSIGPGMKLNTSGGQVREVKVKSMPRILPNQVGTEDNCENDMLFQYSESDITAPRFAKFSFYLDWGFLERYAEAQTQAASIGTPQVGVLREFIDQLMHTVNGLVGHIDNQLLTDVVWGTNVVTGLNTAKTININKDASVLDLSNGVIEMISDAQLNEINGELLIAGSGLMNKYEIVKGVSSADGAGVNRQAVNGYGWYHDINANTNGNWGTNNLGVFAKGTVGFVDIDRYIAWKAGAHGTSEFFQIPLPVANGENVQMVNFNVQIKQIDCPTEIYDGYTRRVVDRGYQVIVSKNYGLWQPPSNLVQTGDRLYGANGALRYVMTNDCAPCPAPTLQ